MLSVKNFFLKKNSVNWISFTYGPFTTNVAVASPSIKQKMDQFQIELPSQKYDNVGIYKDKWH